MEMASKRHSESESGFDSTDSQSSPPFKLAKLETYQVKNSEVENNQDSNIDTSSPQGSTGADSGISSTTSPNDELENEVAPNFNSSDPRGASSNNKSSSSTAEDLNSVRSSARVHHLKMKVDQQRSKESSSSSSTSSELNMESNFEPKLKRAWEQWSSEDKAIFFEALNECGKNFDAIQVFFGKKNRKNKNKEQIRTFYYRTWHKICKYVDLSETTGSGTLHNDLKKSSIEIYGLINFGELRKRLGSQLDDKTGMKLRELIFKGHTNVRIKGKTYRLRTPTCAALKKLSASSDHCGNVLDLHPMTGCPTTVPSKLVLNLTPCTSSDFDLVHRLSQANPHVSLSLRPGRSLASVMEHLKTRWKIPDQPLWILTKDIEDYVEEPLLTVTSGPTTSASLSLSNLNKTSPLLSDPNENDQNEKEKKKEWDLHSAKSLSIGQLYLTLGSTNTIDLNYTFKTRKENIASCMSMLSKLACAELSKKSSPQPAGNLPSSPTKQNIKSANDGLTASASITSTCSTSFIQSTVSASNSSSSNTLHLEENTHHEFRRPLSLPLSKQHQAFKQQLENLMPKYNRRTGRPISRMKRSVGHQPSSANNRLLQPAPTLKSVDGQVKLRLMPNITVTHPVVSITQNATQSTTQPVVFQSGSSSSSSLNLHQSQPELDSGNSNDSITSTLSFFDAGNNQHSTKADHFLDSVLENSNSSVLQTPPRVRQTPPTSPSRAVSSDTWIPDLSSFLGNINSASGTTPQKENKLHHQQSAIISLNEDSVQSTGSEVDRQLISMMGENSVDFTSKFAKLASAVVGVSTSSSSSLQ